MRLLYFFRCSSICEISKDAIPKEKDFFFSEKLRILEKRPIVLFLTRRSYRRKKRKYRSTNETEHYMPTYIVIRGSITGTSTAVFRIRCLYSKAISVVVTGGFKLGITRHRAKRLDACATTVAITEPSRKWWWKSSGLVITIRVPGATALAAVIGWVVAAELILGVAVAMVERNWKLSVVHQFCMNGDCLSATHVSSARRATFSVTSCL